MVGGRCVIDGITSIDIVIHTMGPNTAATAKRPAAEVTVRRTGASFSRMENTVDHANATAKWIAMPMAAVRLPPLSASGPSGTDATPCQSRVTVDP